MMLHQLFFANRRIHHTFLLIYRVFQDRIQQLIHQETVSFPLLQCHKQFDNRLSKHFLKYLQVLRHNQIKGQDFYKRLIQY